MAFIFADQIAMHIKCYFLKHLSLPNNKRNNCHDGVGHRGSTRDAYWMSFSPTIFLPQIIERNFFGGHNGHSLLLARLLFLEGASPFFLWKSIFIIHNYGNWHFFLLFGWERCFKKLHFILHAGWSTGLNAKREKRPKSFGGRRRKWRKRRKIWRKIWRWRRNRRLRRYKEGHSYVPPRQCKSCIPIFFWTTHLWYTFYFL